MRTQVLTFLLVVLFAGSLQQSKPSDSENIPTISYCELIRNSDSYVGKLVRVKATWRYGFEWSYLYDRECMSEEHAWIKFGDEDNLCAATKKNLKKLKDKFDNKADAIVFGKLSGKAGGYGYGDGGYSFQFAVNCLEYAKPIPSNVP